jgi:predicted phosphodiesterase
VARTLIISDTHLGRPHGSAGTAAQLAPLWEGCGRLVINGDLAEVHHPQHAMHAVREVLALQDLCDDAGVELTIISGNHDPLLSDTRHLELAGGQVLVTHGDVLHAELTPWSPSAARLRTAYKAALLALGDDPSLADRLAAAQHAAHCQWLEGGHHGSPLGLVLRHPWVVPRVLRAWRVFPRLAAEFAARHAPRSRFVVVGHTHRAGVHRRGGRIVINTGSFAFPAAPRAVILDGGALCVWPIRCHRGAYTLARRPLREFELEAPATRLAVARRAA